MVQRENKDGDQLEAIEGAWTRDHKALDHISTTQTYFFKKWLRWYIYFILINFGGRTVQLVGS